MFAHYHGQVWDAVRFARSPGASEVRARRSLDMADLPEVVARRCRFIIEESQRVLDLAEALPGGEPGRLFELLSTSYLGARRPVRDRRAGDERHDGRHAQRAGRDRRGGRRGPGSAGAWSHWYAKTRSPASAPTSRRTTCGAPGSSGVSTR